ncbi:unnamed protein product, partial [Amoebophrya sp. A25]
ERLPSSYNLFLTFLDLRPRAPKLGKTQRQQEKHGVIVEDDLKLCFRLFSTTSTHSIAF